MVEDCETHSSDLGGVHYARDGSIDFWGGNFAAIEACDGWLLRGGGKKKKCGDCAKKESVSHWMCSLANEYYGINLRPSSSRKEGTGAVWLSHWAS